jgi:hypothetical protein
MVRMYIGLGGAAEAFNNHLAAAEICYKICAHRLRLGLGRMVWKVM